MKEIALTRKVKEELSQHFSRGGTVHDVKGDLARVPMQSRQQCFEFWQKNRKRNG